MSTLINIKNGIKKILTYMKYILLLFQGNTC